MKYLVEMLADSAQTKPEYENFRDILSRFLEYEISELTDESQRLAVGLPNCYVDFSQDQGIRLICGDIRLSLSDLRRLGLAVASINARIETLEQRINTLIATIASLEDAIATLTTRLITAEGQITDLINRVVALETSITTLTNRVVALEASITTLTNRVVALEGQTTDLINRITTLEQRPSLSAAILEEVPRTSANRVRATANGWNQRDFFSPNSANIFGTNFITNTNGTFTLQAGTYLIYGFFPASGVGAHNVRLVNTTRNFNVLGSDVQAEPRGSLASLTDPLQATTTVTHFLSIQTFTAANTFQVDHYLELESLAGNEAQRIMIGRREEKGGLIILKLA